MAMTLRTRAATAVVLGVAALACVIPFWWELLTTSPGHRNGHTVLGFYLPITAVLGVPGALLLVLGVLVLRKSGREATRGR